MFLTIPAALGLAMLRHPATVLLLERGAFTSADASVVAAALGFYALGIVPQAGIEIHSRGFYALGDTRTPVTFAVGAVVLNFILSALLWHPYGVEGLAFSVSASSWAEWTFLYFFYSRRTGAPIQGDLTAIAKFAFCGAVMAFVLALGFAPFARESRLEEAIIALAGSAAGLAVYAGMAHWLGIEELREATTRIRARIGR
jgi:putative peptidoglycan lipid II flippase